MYFFHSPAIYKSLIVKKSRDHLESDEYPAPESF